MPVLVFLGFFFLGMRTRLKCGICPLSRLSGFLFALREGKVDHIVLLLKNVGRCCAGMNLQSMLDHAGFLSCNPKNGRAEEPSRVGRKLPMRLCVVASARVLCPVSRSPLLAHHRSDGRARSLLPWH